MSTFDDGLPLRTRAVQLRGSVRGGRGAHRRELRIRVVGRVPARGRLGRRRPENREFDDIGGMARPLIDALIADSPHYSR